MGDAGTRLGVGAAGAGRPGAGRPGAAPAGAGPGPARAPGSGRPWRSTALAGAAVVAAGLATARFGTGAVADALGDALYAVLVLLLVRWALPRLASGAHAGLAVGLCWAVEVAQATGGPARAVEAWPPLRYLLGTTFGALDLLWYALGVLAAWGVIVGLSRRRGGAGRAASG